jgi:PIN domain nuclease of toxin-antitoxin system
VRTAWVCPECGLDYSTISPGDALVAVRSFPRRYRALLTTLEQEEGPDSVLHRRPDPGTWSAVEYTAHLADVLDDLATSIRRVMVEDRPRVRAWDADQRAAEQRYAEQDSEQALAALDAACARLARVLDDVDPGDWNRAGTLDWGERDALTLARDAVHEGAHHLRDLERGLRAVRGRPARGEDED